MGRRTVRRRSRWFRRTLIRLCPFRQRPTCISRNRRGLLHCLQRFPARVRACSSMQDMQKSLLLARGAPERMSFVSIEFFVLLAIVFCLYHSFARVAVQNFIVLAASYVFYAWWDWRFL